MEDFLHFTVMSRSLNVPHWKPVVVGYSKRTLNLLFNMVILHVGEKFSDRLQQMIYINLYELQYNTPDGTVQTCIQRNN